MAGPSTKPYNVGQLKSRLMRPALTSHYICRFSPPGSVNTWMSGRMSSGAPGENYSDSITQELIELSCSDASLPGSSLTTNDVNDDYPGVTQKFAYRRLYDTTSDFSFYVDRDYKIISFFEGWLSYISREEYALGLATPNYSYRVRFPDSYRTNNLYITKFEKDTGRPDARIGLRYQFLGAYPVSINSMPVSYEQSQLLKCTVSFAYDRYIVQKEGAYIIPPTMTNPSSPGNPEIPRTPTSSFNQDSINKLTKTVTNQYYNNGISGTNFNQQQAPGNPRQDVTNFTRGIA